MSGGNEIGFVIFGFFDMFRQGLLLDGQEGSGKIF